MTSRLVRPRLALLGLLLLAGCALPPAPTPVAAPAAGIVKPPPAPATAADLPGPHCLPAHQAAIEASLATARPRLAAAIALIEREPQHPHVIRWFGTAPPEEVAGRLRRIAAWMAEAPAGIALVCNDPAQCRQGGRMAYTSPARRLLGLCPAFFRAGARGFDTHWGVLIHEASHLVAGTRDHAYGPQAAAILAKEDPDRAAENADNYEYFVETLPVRDEPAPYNFLP